MEVVVAAAAAGVNLQVSKRSGCFSATHNGSHWILKVTSSWREHFNWMVYSLISKIVIFLVLSAYGSFLALIISHTSGSGTVSAVYCCLPCENGSPPPTTTLLLSISFLAQYRSTITQPFFTHPHAHLYLLSSVIHHHICFICSLFQCLGDRCMHMCVF